MNINMLAISASNCGPTLTVMVLFLISSSSFNCRSLRISLQRSSRLRVPSWPRQFCTNENPAESSKDSIFLTTTCSIIFGTWVIKPLLCKTEWIIVMRSTYFGIPHFIQRSISTKTVISVWLQSLLELFKGHWFPHVGIHVGVRVLIRIILIINNISLLIKCHEIPEIVRVRTVTVNMSNLPIQVFGVIFRTGDRVNTILKKF